MNTKLTPDIARVGSGSLVVLRPRDLLESYERTILDIRERAAVVCQLAETEASLRQGREIIILCERALAQHNNKDQTAAEHGKSK